MANIRAFVRNSGGVDYTIAGFDKSFLADAPERALLTVGRMVFGRAWVPRADARVAFTVGTGTCRVGDSIAFEWREDTPTELWSTVLALPESWDADLKSELTAIIAALTPPASPLVSAF